MSCVILKSFSEPPFSKREILRYAGCKESTAEIEALLDSCIEEIRGALSYKICYKEFPLSVKGNLCDLSEVSFRSQNLAQTLSGCSRAVLFSATVGIEIDRAILKYGKISPSRALMLQAIGAERIEALCDAFCKDIAAAKPRFSAGYGDLPIEYQKDIFSMLSPEKHIGLCLNDSFLMSPSKSVTAIVGLY